MILFLQGGTFTIYTITAFCASIIWGITGFGNALILLAVHQVVEFTGIMDRSTIKYTIFLQGIGLIALSSFAIVYQIRDIKTFSSWKLVIPIIFINFPLGFFGTWLKKFAPTSIIRIVCGVVALISTLIKLYQKFVPYLSGETKEPESTSDALDAVIAEIDDKKCIPMKSFITFLIACCFFGILGGLIGAGGPTLIIYFLFFPAEKGVVRVVGVIGSFAIAVSRIITYSTTSPPLDDSWPTTKYQNRNTTEQVYQFDMSSWFIRNDMYLYISVVIASIFGCIVGTYLHERVNQKVFNLILVGVLFLSSIIMIVKGVLETL